MKVFLDSWTPAQSKCRFGFHSKYYKLDFNKARCLCSSVSIYDYDYYCFIVFSLDRPNFFNDEGKKVLGSCPCLVCQSCDEMRRNRKHKQVTFEIEQGRPDEKRIVDVPGCLHVVCYSSRTRSPLESFQRSRRSISFYFLCQSSLTIRRILSSPSSLQKLADS